MKNLNTFITEKFRLSRDCLSQYNYHPKTRTELIKIVDKLIDERGPNADLNDIDTSEITSMFDVFHYNNSRNWKLRDFNGDISQWDVSNVENMAFMFYNSNFNGDISKWDVSNVEMMSRTFYGSDFNQDISNWNTSNLEVTRYMFAFSNFNQDISNWNTNKIYDMEGMFTDCPLGKNPPAWYKE